MNKLNLAAMLPHRKPMLMISEVKSHTKQKLVALSLIEQSNPLLQNGKFPGYAGLELLAQASGLFLALTMDGNAKPGAIISVRDMQIYQTWLSIEQVMNIETVFLGGSDRAAMFQGQVYQAGEMVMQATLTVSSFPEGDIA